MQVAVYGATLAVMFVLMRLVAPSSRGHAVAA